jgi:hypothetical protein
MSRRDYIATAEILREAAITPEQHALLAGRFADYFEQRSERFDRARFLEAVDSYDWTKRNRIIAV